MKSSQIIFSGILLIMAAVLVNPAMAYNLDAEMIEPNGMIFPVGQFIPDDLSNADEIKFRDMTAIFRMMLEDDNPADPSDLILMIRMQVAGEDPIFTVSSQAINIRNVLADGMWRTNVELANPALGLHIGDGDEVNAQNVLPYIDGGNMIDNLYILTVVLADPTYTTADFDLALNNNYGIISATTKVRNPNQVELLEPTEDEEILGYPIFKWNFPRNPGVEYNLLLVQGEEGTDANTALDFANETSTFLDTTFTAGDEGGEMTSYLYSGTGGERPLERGNLYHWRVTARALTMFGDVTEIVSVPGTFSFGNPPPIEILGPNNGTVIPTATIVFKWAYEIGFGMEEIELVVTKGDILTGEVYGRFSLPVFGGVEDYNVTYKGGLDGAKDLTAGDYEWQLTGTGNTDGTPYTIESEVRTFRFEPQFELLYPTGRSFSPKAASEGISFGWQLPYKLKPTSFNVKIEERSNNLVWQNEYPEGTTGVPAQDNPQFLKDGEVGDYTWEVEAILPDGKKQLKSSSFHIVYPQLRMTYPRGEIYTKTPTLTWEWTPDDQPSQYTLLITKGDFSEVLQTVDVGANLWWEYEGDSLRIDSTYGAKVIAETEAVALQTVDSTTFKYTSVPERTIDIGYRLSRPRNHEEFVDGGQTVTFRWWFPELGPEYELNQEITLTPLDVFTKDPGDEETEVPEDVEYVETVKRLIDDNDNSISIDDLETGYKYEWYLTANYVTLKGDPVTVESEKRTILYDPTLWGPDSPQSELISKLEGRIPEDLMELIKQLRREKYHWLGEIRIDGTATDLETMIQLLSREDINLVQMNITR